MRVVHCLQWLQLGGAEQVALALARRQRAQGHDAVILSLGGPTGPLAARCAAAGVPVWAPRAAGRGREPALWPRLALGLLRRRPDVVHTHDPRSLVYAGPAARAVGARLVHTKHGDDGAGGGHLLGWTGRLAHAVVGVSQATAEQAVEARAGRVHVIPNGVDLSRRAEPTARARIRRSLGVLDGELLLGCVGRLAPVKGPDVLLDALADGALAGWGARLVFVGDGALRAELQARASDRVHFLGLRSDVPDLLAAMDLYVQPSRSEGLPLALLEALAAGLPAVATAVGGVPGAVGAAARLVPPQDPAALREALGALVADPAARVALGAAGARAAARHDVRHTVQAYLALYRGGR